MTRWDKITPRAKKRYFLLAAQHCRQFW